MAFIIALILLSIITLPLVLIICVCHGRSKKNNSNNVLPLNSMRNGDLPSNLELVSYNQNILQTNLVEVDGSRNKHITFNRALPDIPSTESNHRQDLDDTLVQSPLKRLKQRAPQPPVDSHPHSSNVIGTSAIHHSYAKIKTKDKSVDSSTENDTDDYCDPHSSYFLSNKSETELNPPTVPAKRFANPDNLNYLFQPSTSASHAVAGRVPSAEIPYMTPQDVEIDQNDNQDSFNHSSQKVISYNTISVREPLAKVLAEHGQSEHHYIEVEDQISSFYEEIAGSAASSVTYSRIGYPKSAQHNDEPHYNEGGQEPPALPSLESLMVAAESIRNISPPLKKFPVNQELYSSVNKSPKNNKKQGDNQLQSSDLYAKVQKIQPNERNSTTNTNGLNENLHQYEIPGPSGYQKCRSNPPPLPPIVNLSHHPKTRTISMYDSGSSYVPEVPQRRFSSSLVNHSEYNANSFKLNQTEEQDPIEDNTNDPGYEIIQKRPNDNLRLNTNRIQSLPNGCLPNMASGDPAYESIIYDESDYDPAYETISKKVSRKESERAEPGYEVIKKQRPFSSPTIPNVSRTESDLSSEPGYERVLYISKINVESEPPYASIKKNGEEDDDDNERLNERL